MPTHYHDDHVAGFNLLREVEGTEVWSPENVAPILERSVAPRPALPVVRPDSRRPRAAARSACRVARVRADAVRAARAHALRGRDRVRGRRGACSRPATSRPRAAARRRGHPQLPVPQPLPHRRLRRERRALPAARPDADPERPLAAARGQRRVPGPAAAEGARLAELHRELLPLDEVDFGAEGFGARIEPYRSRASRAAVRSR